METIRPSVADVCVYRAANMPAPVPRLNQFSPNQGMPFARAAAPPYAAQVRLQSSDSIQIQMEPLQSMDSYASRLMSPGTQVAIYSGRCPLLKLAAYQPPRATQQQACNPLSTRPDPGLLFDHFCIFHTTILHCHVLVTTCIINCQRSHL